MTVTDRKGYTCLPPLDKEGMDRLHWDTLDFVYILGDAYIDHPSFGAALITRTLMNAGYRVGIIAQPDWHGVEPFRALGRPKLGFLVSAGNIDSMVAHYTAAKKHRSEDMYTPGGKTGKRPDRASVVYCNRCREAFPGVPVLLGGLEASLRRFAHYDYWDDRVRHSLLYDSGADILMYGMGERTVLMLAEALKAGTPVKEITSVPGTCFQTSDISAFSDAVTLPSYREVTDDKKQYAGAYMLETRENNHAIGKRLVQAHEKGYLVVNPPAAPLTREEMDTVYGFPYTRLPHPVYKEKIPAIDEVSFSLTSCRGCFGACSFCALTFHQGRIIQSRSVESLIGEAEQLTKMPGFKGYIHDVGGPTANFRQPACEKQMRLGACPDRQCIGYKPCPNLKCEDDEYTELLKKLRRVPGVKRVFVRSGVRFDYALMCRNSGFLKELAAYHISGQLKVAPEHVSDRVLYYMNKPPHRVYEEFVKRYAEENKKLGREQFLVPYYISSHPGCTLEDAVALAQYIRTTGHRPEQVQDFYPTPGTLSTCMYYTGLDPRDMKPVHIPKDEEKAMQRALMQYWLPQNRTLVLKALRMTGRTDLIGFGREQLIPPREIAGKKHAGEKTGSTKKEEPGKPRAGSVRRPAQTRKPGPGKPSGKPTKKPGRREK